MGVDHGTCGHLAFVGKVGEEVIDSGAPEFEWVDLFSLLISVMDQVSGDPADVGLFGTFSGMECASDSAHFIDQLRLHDCDKRIWFRVHPSLA
jgi:hypothetical protein